MTFRVARAHSVWSCIYTTTTVAEFSFAIYAFHVSTILRSLNVLRAPGTLLHLAFLNKTLKLIVYFGSFVFFTVVIRFPVDLASQTKVDSAKVTIEQIILNFKNCFAVRSRTLF